MSLKAQSTTNETDLVAAFLAKGGQITRLDTSATNGMTWGDWRDAVRGVKTPQTTYEASERAHEQRVERIREAAHTGGRNAAINEMNRF